MKTMDLLSCLLRYCLAVLVVLALPTGGAAFETALIYGRVLDANGRPVVDATVAAYDSPDVKRPADFTARRTGPDGTYRLTVPAGTYWLVAVERRGGGTGPLQLGDRHSGEPLKVVLAAGDEKRRDFTVLDLRDAARRYAKQNEELVTVRGTVVDARGRPVAMAYVVADAKTRIRDFPTYLSGWTGADGRFVLYLAPGTYHVAALTTWPPAWGTTLSQTIDCRWPVDDVRLVIGEDAGDEG